MITNETRTSIKKIVGYFGMSWRYMKRLKCIISFRKMKRATLNIVKQEFFKMNF